MQTLCSIKSDEKMVSRKVFASGCGLFDGTNTILAFIWRARTPQKLDPGETNQSKIQTGYPSVMLLENYCCKNVLSHRSNIT
jgi:hypothetical protein